MTQSGLIHVLIVVAAAALAACQNDVVVIEEEYPLTADVDPKCVLDIRVYSDGRTLWKGEAISDEEFGRRLQAGRIKEVCIEPKAPPPSIAELP